MKTVKDYFDLGLVFVGDDRLLSVTNFKDSKEACMSGLCIAHQRYCDGFLGGNAIFFHPSEWTPTSFAWRNSDGVKPAFLGTIEIEWSDGSNSIQKSPYSSYWAIPSAECSIEIVKWRPVVLQSYDENDNKDESFKLPIGIDSPELREAFKSLKEHLENKPPFWNKSIKTLNCPCVAVNVETNKPTVSPKEDNLMKPVYTAEMHAKNELPQVGAECEALCMDAMNSKHVWTKAKILMHHDGNECAVYCIDAGVLRWADEFKPIAKTIKVNGFDVPAPMSEAPERGAKFYNPSICYHDYFDAAEWIGDENDILWLSRGLIHSTKSAAIAHSKAMLGIDPAKDIK